MKNKRYSRKYLHVSRLNPLVNDVGLLTEELVHAEPIQLDAREFTNLRQRRFQDSRKTLRTILQLIISCHLAALIPTKNEIQKTRFKLQYSAKVHL